jgi:hypothetical protein
MNFPLAPFRRGSAAVHEGRGLSAQQGVLLFALPAESAACYLSPSLTANDARQAKHMETAP